MYVVKFYYFRYLKLEMRLKQRVFGIFFLMSFLTFSQRNIFDASRFGTVDEIKKLMTKNPDTINKVDVTGYLPLTLACYNGNAPVAIFLAGKVKDVNSGGKFGTPLMAAVFKGHIEIVKTLLQWNADPNLADANGTTPLHYAVLKGNEVLAKVLIDAKADVASKDNRGRTPLDYAFIANNQNIIQLLEKK